MIEDKNIIFRPMQADDLDAVITIDKLSFSMPWPKSAYMHDLIGNPHALLRVAVDESFSTEARVVGMIDVWLVLDEAHIATLAVHPDYRGRGIAKKLIDLVLDEAYQRGAKQAMLEVRATNHAAQSLYRKFGFQTVHRRRRYYIDNKEDALLMNLEDLEAYIRSEKRLKLRRVEL